MNRRRIRVKQIFCSHLPEVGGSNYVPVLLSILRGNKMRKTIQPQLFQLFLKTETLETHYIRIKINLIPLTGKKY